MTNFYRLFVVVLIVNGVALAQSAPPLYKQVARFEVGGEGGWDYITYDASSNRLFVAHSTEITVVDASTGRNRKRTREWRAWSRRRSREESRFQY
jgi:hypothetical protein